MQEKRGLCLLDKVAKSILQQNVNVANGAPSKKLAILAGERFYYLKSGKYDLNCVV
jgi:hypothetical protein